MDITLEKVGYIIQMARRIDLAQGEMEMESGSDSLEDVDFNTLEDNPETSEADEVADYIDGLNTDEALDLVALMWVGRGTFTAKQFSQARTLAAEEATHSAAEYLLGTPLLADYLEGGLEALGFSVEEAEEG